MFTDLELQRRQKRQQLQELGIDPYPAAAYPVTHLSKDICDNFELHPDNFTNVCLAGRLMSRRIMGKAAFAELQDSSGKIQIYVNRDDIASDGNTALYNQVFKKLTDIGDFIGIQGYVFKTKVGEITIYVKKFTVLTKSLKPLPVVKKVLDKEGKEVTYNEVSNPEFRYRQRYIDLILHSHVKEIFIKRAQLINTMRDFFNKRGYLEVETPILQPLYGGALAEPFTTHHNTLDTTFYLRIANELYLKRLIVGGLDAVYEFAKDFRNEGMSRFHNPEFTMLELYVAYKDYYWMSQMTEELIENIALKLHSTTKVQVGENTIDFQRPWKQWTIYEAIEHFTGKDLLDKSEKEIVQIAEELGIKVDNSMKKGKLIDEIFGTCCEPQIIQPTFITDYPREMSPLSKKHRKRNGLVERFEVICNGKEICNAFSELNDPVDQRERMEAQVELRKAGEKESMPIDQDFLRALEYGMPPTAGIGIGIDRLTMIMTDSPSIQEVILFPQMRSENQ